METEPSLGLLKDGISAEDVAKEIEQLKERRAQIISTLNTIRNSMIRSGELVGECCGGTGIIDRAYDIHWLTHKPRGSTHHRLTYRGLEKVKELLDRFDIDHDGCLDFSEFMGYLCHFRRLTEFGQVMEHEEAFQSYMHDLYHTERGKLTTQGFIRYREDTESDHSLARDLEYMGMDPMPRQARAFRNARLAFDRVDVEAQGFAMDRLLRRGSKITAVVKPVGRVPMSQLQLLLGDCGESLSVARGKELMLYHNDHMRVVQSLQRRAQRRQFGRRDDKPVDADDVANVYKDGFLAWFMSGRPKEDSVPLLERKLIQFKNTVRRAVRDAFKARDFMWSYLMLGIKRGLIVAQLFKSRKQDMGRYDVGARLGRGSTSSGFAVIAKLQQLESERAARQKQQIPSTCGMAFSFDLMLKLGLTDKAVAAAVHSLRAVLSEHFESEITKLPKFQQWQVLTTTSDLDHSRVIRVAVYLKNDMNIDNVLKGLQLGFTVRDVVSDLSFELKTNFDWRTLAENEETVLEEELAARMDFRCNVCRGVLSTLIDETWAQVEYIHTDRSTQDEYEANAARKAKERSMEANSKLTAGFLRETFRYHFTRTPAIEEDLAGLKKSVTEDAEFEGMIDFDFYRRFKHWVKVLQHYMRGSKSVTLDFKWQSLKEALAMNFLKASVPLWVREGLLGAPGGVAMALKKWRGVWWGEVEKTRRNLSAYERERERRRKEEEQKQEQDDDLQTRRKQVQMEKQAILKRLQALGLGPGVEAETKGPEAEEAEDNDESRMGVLRKMWKSHQKSQKALIDLYRALSDTVVAPHSLHITSGRYRLYVHVEGCDIWDVFLKPMPPERPASAGSERQRS